MYCETNGYFMVFEYRNDVHWVYIRFNAGVYIIGDLTVGYF